MLALPAGASDLVGPFSRWIAPKSLAWRPSCSWRWPRRRISRPPPADSARLPLAHHAQLPTTPNCPPAVADRPAAPKRTRLRSSHRPPPLDRPPNHRRAVRQVVAAESSRAPATRQTPAIHPPTPAAKRPPATHPPARTAAEGRTGRRPWSPSCRQAARRARCPPARPAIRPPRQDTAEPPATPACHQHIVQPVHTVRR